MHVQNISTSNITTYTNESMQATFTMHTSQLETTLLTASPSLSHALNSMNLQHIWACKMTFQLEGGCWNSYWNPIEQVGMVLYYFILSRRFMGPCGHGPAPQSFNSYIEYD